MWSGIYVEWRVSEWIWMGRVGEDENRVGFEDRMDRINVRVRGKIRCSD